MKPNRSIPSYLRRLMVAQACALLAVSTLLGQQANPPPATTEAPSGGPAVKMQTTTSGAPTSEETVKMSPFIINTTKDAGYFAENTLAGSRLNTNISDLAASITVVNKQQMEDTGSIDINDVFRYEVSTEGSATFTPVIIDRNTAKDVLGGYSDSGGAMTGNYQANRIRGMTAPDQGINNFPTNKLIPFDSYNTQSVEITRGPNSLLFGLGTPAGIVNQTMAQAALNKDTNEVTGRTDAYGSARASLAINRVLIPDKLAFYGAYLYNNQQFQRKPSGDLTRRLYGTITYKPFKNTTIRAFAESFSEAANRPNGLVPRDLITPWLQAGRPGYDPTTRSITVLDTGKVYGPYVSSTLSAGYVAGNFSNSAAASTPLLSGVALPMVPNPQFVQGIMFEDISRPIRLIDGSTSVAYFQRQNPLYAPAQTSPATAVPTPTTLGWLPGDSHYMIYDRQWTSSTVSYPVTIVSNNSYPVIGGVPYQAYQNPGVTNKSIYNWDKYNTIQTNFADSRAANYSFEIDQQLLPNLFFNAGWFRQDIHIVSNDTMGALTGNTLQVDTNMKLPDGTVNPYFGAPFIEEGAGGGMDTFYIPERDDNYRAMLSYTPDFTKQNNFLKWLGHHRFLAMWSRQESKSVNERWRNGYVDGDPDAKLRYVQNLALSGQNIAAAGLTLMRKYYMGAPGGPQGVVTHSSGFWGNQGWNRPATSQIEVYNYTTQAWQQDTVTEQALFFGGSRTRRQVNSWTLAAQDYLLNDRLVTTFGFRHDMYRAGTTSTGALTTAQGITYAPALTTAQQYVNGYTGALDYNVVMNRWGRWDYLRGNTRTIGGAFHMLKDVGFVQNIGGRDSLVSQFLNGLTLYINKSANFNPPSVYATDYFTKAPPAPTGKGKDVGIGFSLFHDKLVGRINWYRANNTNERTAAAATLVGRLAYEDYTLATYYENSILRIQNAEAAGKTFAQIIADRNWNTDASNNVSDETNQRKVYAAIGLPYLYYNSVINVGSGATQNSEARGTELQITYNPSPNWTMKFSADKQRTVYSNIAPQYDAWLAVRMPVWLSLVSPFPIGAPENTFTDAGGAQYSMQRFWTAYGYSTNAILTSATGNTASGVYFNNIIGAAYATAKALEGATSPDQRKYHANFLTNYQFTTGKLKGWTVGGAERWESAAIIGFYGKVNDPVGFPGVVNFIDPSKPVYDSGNYYTDLWVAYGRKIFSNKIGWKIQLNIINAFESGHLQPIAVNFDGLPYAWRIVDPRQFVLSSTFSF